MTRPPPPPPTAAPTHLLAVDPGLRECGIALLSLSTGKLVRAWLVRSREKELMHNPGWSALGLAALESLESRFPELCATPGSTWLIGETPRLHEKHKQTALENRMNPNTLFQTAGASAAVGMALALRGISPPHLQRGVEADLWTGGRGKQMRQRSARGAVGSAGNLEWEDLPEAERVVIDEEAKTNLHHVLDAVDLGRWFLPRLRMGAARGEGPTLPERSQKKAVAKALKAMNLKPASSGGAGAPVPFGRRMPAAAPQQSEGRVPYGQRLRAEGRLPTPAYEKPRPR